MDLKISPEDLNKVISAAILSMLTPEKREEMITLALQGLLDPQPSTGYGSARQSKLQEAFNDAAVRVARDVFITELQKPEHKARLGAVVTKALDKALLDDGLPDRLASVVADALSGRGR